MDRATGGLPRTHSGAPRPSMTPGQDRDQSVTPDGPDAVKSRDQNRCGEVRFGLLAGLAQHGQGPWPSDMQRLCGFGAAVEDGLGEGGVAQRGVAWVVLGFNS